ncbi:MAG: hypothetical protein A3H97_05670 [Acidobacteria bacterium RIFCSPLOWO2_02_FULL_65_29]|nr:MAG: hypothetical protein A3H97_05670 [Acidobacteria bacterium RIFCSPLOWO2_02_FULL_65_29]
MNTTCTYHGDRDEMLIAYLYDDIEAADRDTYERHLAACPACRRELGELGAVRDRLSRWSPPEPARGVDRRAASAPDTGRVVVGPSRWLTPMTEVPVWARAAAAALVFGVAAGAANLHVTYDTTGFSVRTGWMAPASAGNAAAGRDVAQDQPVPWGADLAALEARLRSDMRTSVAPPATRVASARDGEAADLLKRVRALVDESETRQERELALRMAEIATDVRAQRVADLRTIERIQSNTGVDMMRLYRMTNDLAVRVAQVR